jgi:hypothetical protein
MGERHSSLTEWHENVLRGLKAYNVFGEQQIIRFIQHKVYPEEKL